MKRPVLTILLIVDTEKDSELTDFFFVGLRKWNRRAMDRVQVILITQKDRDPHSHRVAARQPFPVSVVHAEHQTVDGYPLWDVCEEARQVWPLVKGEYVTFNHQEFLHCPHRLEYTLDYLELIRPTIALGNLRHLGPLDPKKEYLRQRGRKESEVITDKLRQQASYLAAVAVEAAPSTHWLSWMEPPKAGECKFIEDVFFVRREWCEAMRFFWQADDLIFQDVYDLFSTACERLGRVGLEPDCVRLDQDTHRAVHLWHPATFESFRPEIRDWFFTDPKRWAGTNFLRMDLWDRLIGRNGQVGWLGNDKALWAFRRGRGSTVARFVKGLDDWTRTPVGMLRIARQCQTSLS